jgi:hypothetical protein
MVGICALLVSRRTRSMAWYIISFSVTMRSPSSSAAPFSPSSRKCVNTPCPPPQRSSSCDSWFAPLAVKMASPPDEALSCCRKASLIWFSPRSRVATWPPTPALWQASVMTRMSRAYSPRIALLTSSMGKPVPEMSLTSVSCVSR